MSQELYITIDTETGGFNQQVNPLLQVGMHAALLDTDNMTAVTISSTEWNVKPSQFINKIIEPEALSVNQLKLEQLEETGMLIGNLGDSMRNEIMKAIDFAGHKTHKYLLGQNLAFDLRFLREYLPSTAVGLLYSFRFRELMDKVEDYHIVSPGPARSSSLSAVSAELGIVNESAHTALSDAKTTFECMLELNRRFKEFSKAISSGQSSSSDPVLPS